MMSKKHKLILASAVVALVVVVGTRAVQIYNENSRIVFNIARDAAVRGMPVETITATTKSGILLEPVAVRGNRIFVSGARVGKFRVGQKLSGGGRIESVSSRIDLDTGLFAIRTSGASNGNSFVEMSHNGIFVPLSAVQHSQIMVAENGIAVQKNITVVATDATTAVIRGINDGDEIILTRVTSGTKIRK
ncbi:MAG: hypothetical protein FWF34_00515 [Alphaproteobacteria bacterium]|nr:hypothetical protein [Alphaproteobacteria bacterium]MCL2889730.1 hypothetical protein [Alphaproteobacteria bacterium]